MQAAAIEGMSRVPSSGFATLAAPARRDR